jgi:transcriptional regulator with XRE-family HTH domain
VETPSALARIRGRRGLTQRELAIRSDLTIETISDIERGDTTRPQLSTIRKLATGLEMDFDELVALLTEEPEDVSA